MKMHFYRRSLLLTLLLLLAVPTLGHAGDEELFQLTRSILNDQADPGEWPLAARRSQCLESLAALNNEKQSGELLELWSKEKQRGAEGRLSTCWKQGLYWAGLNYAPDSGLTLDRKLASLAGHTEVPPEKLITQLLAQEKQPISKLDQSMVKLLRFAARYDRALKSENSKAELHKLVPDVNELAPQALQLLEKRYPSSGYYHFSYHPVKAEVAQCAFAMLTIVPVEQHSPELKTLSRQLELLFGLGCVHRGWYAAFDTGIALLAKKDKNEGLALLVWKSDFLEYPEVSAPDSVLLSPDIRKTSPKLAHIVSGVNSCLSQLRKQTYKKNPEVFTRLLQEPDSELWRFQVLLSLETARLRADHNLLQLTARSLLEQSERLYSTSREEYENSPNDLCYLYFSAFYAAQRLNDRKLQDDLLSRLLKLYPQMGDYYTDVLYDQQSKNLDWFYLFSDRALAPVWRQKFEAVLLKDSGPQGFSKSEFGMLWATFGTTEIDGKAILTMYKEDYNLMGIAWGAGYAVGRGRAALPVCATWQQLSQIDPRFNTVTCFVEFCGGYAKGKEKESENWDARFLQVLGPK
ncbi:hypothetical protein [Gimesia algae]|uniref:Uncharacterized protein n=1 Tax=Gimesia algae TaxID=2527971 RepID=A0A517VDJ6_9PLAN|nr:hypothetical protein [Gimesia algae]QDT91085.1 hypothetical protein Pan161_27400 [Gimesia algae]